MKTFLRTTLFWLVASIAFLIVSGFGYGKWRITPVFDQLYLIKRLPSQVVQTIELQGWDRALQEQSNNEIPPLQTQIEEVADTATLLIGQTNLSQQMNEHFIQLSQQLSQQFQSLITLCQGDGLTLGQVSDETGWEEDAAIQRLNEINQRKTDIQAQIDALKLEMETLTT